MDIHDYFLQHDIILFQLFLAKINTSTYIFDPECQIR